MFEAVLFKGMKMNRMLILFHSMKVNDEGA